MDPITTTAIVTAIAAGAAAGASDVASQAIHDAYNGLKTLIQRKFGDHAAVIASMQQVETHPDSETWQNALEDSLDQVHAYQDSDIATQTQALLKLLKEQGVGATYLARLEGSGAIAQGPGAMAAGRGGVAIGGDVSGSVIITGDGNEVKKDERGE